MTNQGNQLPGSRPPNVEEVVRQANNFDYNEHIPLKYWLQSANTIQKEAQIYEREGNETETYLLLYRHAQLVLNKLSKHPEAKDKKNRAALSKANKLVRTDLEKLEKLKPSINKRHQKYLEYVARRGSSQTRRGSKDNIFRADSVSQTSNETVTRSRRKVSDSSMFPEKRNLEAGENTELAAQLAEREIRRRDAARRSVRQAGVSPEEEHERRTGGLWGNWEEALAKGKDDDDAGDLSRQIQQLAIRREEAFPHPNGFGTSNATPAYSAQYSYPQVPQKSISVTRLDIAELQPPPSGPFEPSTLDNHRPPDVPPRIPIIPPKESKNSIGLVMPPPIPGKIRELDITTVDPQIPSASVPELNASDYRFKPSAYLENGTPLRTMFINPNLRHQFLTVAASNTKKNLETCGMLCGTLISNALFISKLVIPEQESTSDTCETVNESTLFDYCDSEDLMLLGWIHTHPTQTCFMSSRDLHTHCGYQVMLPESIAIVCAPSKDPSWGVFRLTDPPGMKVIQNCKQTGLFHPHAQTEIYTDALRPGHVHELPGLSFEVVDLRPNK